MKLLWTQIISEEIKLIWKWLAQEQGTGMMWKWNSVSVTSTRDCLVEKNVADEIIIAQMEPNLHVWNIIFWQNNCQMAANQVDSRKLKCKVIVFA